MIFLLDLGCRDMKNYYTFDEFIEKIYKPRDLEFPIIDLYEAMMQYGGCVAIEVEGEEFIVCTHSQEVVKECSSEMNDFINSFTQVV